jgi:hypothetical protein
VVEAEGGPSAVSRRWATKRQRGEQVKGAMDQELNVGVIGDFDPNRLPHVPANSPLKHTAEG